MMTELLPKGIHKLLHFYIIFHALHFLVTPELVKLFKIVIFILEVSLIFLLLNHAR